MNQDEVRQVISGLKWYDEVRIVYDENRVTDNPERKIPYVMTGFYDLAVEPDPTGERVTRQSNENFWLYFTNDSKNSPENVKDCRLIQVRGIVDIRRTRHNGEVTKDLLDILEASR